MNGAGLRDLCERGPLLVDGGLSTALIERGFIDPDACVERLSLDEPDAVADVHREFVEAGARMIETNTFGANRFSLAQHGLADRVAEINRLGVEIARGAATETGVPGVLVAGSVGPLHVRLAPYGRVRKAEARAAYGEQIEALAAAGADLIVIETQSDLAEMGEALRAAREACDLAVIVLATFNRDDRTFLGSTPEAVASRLVDLGADGIGVNCSEGPAQVLRIASAMVNGAGAVPVAALPNAGGPTRVGERLVYPATPEYLASYARSFLAAGISIVGGCCGTGPEHIAAMAEALREPRQLHLEIIGPEPTGTEAAQAAAPSALANKLAAGAFVVTVEMDPPRSTSVARMLAGAETLRDAGADAIDVADSPLARMRMSPWAPARLIEELVGIETVLHFPIRGRNLLRIQGDLLAAHALGIRNLFVVLGDPTRIGEYPEATDSVDVVPTGLISLVTGSLNAGTDQLGASIGEPTNFLVGCAVNMAPADLDKECRLLKKKVDAGADFALSMPVYSPDTLRLFRKAYEERHGPLDLPILAGVLPLVTHRHAEFLHNELPGVSIPDEVSARMKSASGGAKRLEEAEGLQIATELIDGLRAEAAQKGGIYLMSPFGRYDLAAEIIERVRSVEEDG